MSQIVADAELAKQLSALDGPVNIVDASGTVLAVCTPPGVRRSPYTREEVEAAREQCRRTGGKSLAEFVAQLEGKTS
jgi:hypothetical protein